MLHTYIQRFDVTDTVEIFLGTKQRCMPDSLRRVREVQNQRMHGLQIQMHIIREHTNGDFLSVSGIRLEMMELRCTGHPMLTSHDSALPLVWRNWRKHTQQDEKKQTVSSSLTRWRKSQQLTRRTSSNTVNVKSYMRARSWYYTRAAFVDIHGLQ